MTEAIEPTDRGAAPGSILGQLSQRRKDIIEGDFRDYRIPRWSNPSIFVRCRPLPHEVIDKARKRVERVPKAERSAAELNANADLLVHASASDGVFAMLPGDETRYSLNPADPTGEWTLFDADLAANLGLPEGSTARQVCRALFLADGDLMATVAELIEFSGYTTERADEEVLGE